MTYAIQLVQIEAFSFGLQSSSTPWPTVPFPFMLYSGWHCNPLGLLPGSLPTGNSVFTFGPVTAFKVEVANSTSGTTCSVTILNSGNTLFQATYAILSNNCQNHVMVSANCLTQTIQVYANDAPCPQLNGGWVGAGLMFKNVDLTVGFVGAIGSNFPAIADIWSAATPVWIDLNVVANRRKFINHNLSPVSLAADGSKPFGYQPPVFLSCENGNPNDIATNYGSGGPFAGISSNVFLQSGVCTVLSIPSPPIGISFAEVFDPSYLDFSDEDYVSFALSSFVMSPQAPITKLQAPYLVFYFNTDAQTNDVDMHFRWGFAQNPNSGKFSSVQRLSTTDTVKYQYQGLRRKVRGAGRAFQVGFFSVSGKPFDVTGWVIENSMNTQA